MSETQTQTQQSSEDITEKACDFLMGVLDRMGMTADIDVREEEDRTVLEVQGADVELLTGKRGMVIEALQHLVAKVASKHRGGEKGKPFVIDAGGYRAKQVERLHALAAKLGEKALTTNSIVELSPMSAHDRRIVHMAVAAMAGLSSRSEGEGDDRHILLVPESLEAAAK